MNSAKSLHVPKAFTNFRIHLQNSVAETVIISPGLVNPGIQASKFAGYPYLPQDSPYPKDDDGQPMLFLAQLNFSEFQLGEPFPTHGILQFYIVQKCYSKIKLGIPATQFKVRYYPTLVDAAQLTTDFNSLGHLNYEHFPIDQELAIQFSKAVEPVSATDYRLTQFFNPLVLNETITIDGRSFIDLYLESFLSADHKIGGYPYFIKQDMRQHSVLLQRYDTLLLQIISNDAHGIMWGDCGVISFFINSEKLKGLDFSDIYFHTEEY